MRNYYFFLFVFLSVFSNAQKLKVIKATSAKAFTVEDNEEKVRWNLDPRAKPDVYITNKSSKKKWVKLVTDKDSIKVSIKPGEHYDFVVLLNDKDSCFTRFENPAKKDFSNLKPEIHDTIPFVLSDFNNIIMKVKFDGKTELDLKFDSGTRDFLLTNDAIKRFDIKNLSNHIFQIGDQIFKNQRIFPVELSGQGTEGRFGWNLFDGKIVEINYDKKIFVIHSKMPKMNSGYQKFDINYSHSLFCINGELQIGDKKFDNQFLFDTGYQKTIMLDADQIKAQQYPKDQIKVLKKVIMKNGRGEEIPVLTVNNEKLNLKKFMVKDIPVQLMTGNNPAWSKIHILGNEVLKRFNTFIDFQKNVVYLKPNSLFDVKYEY